VKILEKTKLSLRADKDLVDAASEIYQGSINSLLQSLLEDYVLNNRPSLEILLAREEELKNELKKVGEQIVSEQQRLSGVKSQKKATEKAEKEETPLDSVKKAIYRQLENSSIETIMNSVYMKAFQKKLGWDEQQIINLILSLAPEDKLKEYATTCHHSTQYTEVSK